MTCIVICHNSADSAPTSDPLVTTRPIPYLYQSSSVLQSPPLELLSIAGIIYYTCILVIDIQCTRQKLPSTNAFNE